MKSDTLWLPEENSDNSSVNELFEDLEIAKSHCEKKAAESNAVHPLRWVHLKRDDSWCLHDANSFPLWTLYKFTRLELPSGVEWRVVDYDER